ncbi:MAG: hypothetical protein JOZ08_26165 [Verrucomicrobia bacterium]|nr:hypothetical protein [Verrucomicrobiota bacterium]
MSYDLYFGRGKPLTETEFFSYFLGRRNYTRQNRQAWYSNDHTGVYFNFLISDPNDLQDAEKPRLASFNINLYRPHFFGLEAGPELDAFIEHFELTVIDPQEKERERFSVERFLSNWNQANEFGYKASLNLGRSPAEVHVRPSTELEAIWRWNYEVPRIQTELGQNVFVPRIVWINADGDLNSAAVWPDGIATLVPAVEKIIVPRNKMAPRNLLSRQKDMCFIDQSLLDQCLAPLEAGRYPLPCRTPAYLSPPKNVDRFVRALTPERRKMEGVSMDKVLDAEIVEGAKRQGESLP